MPQERLDDDFSGMILAGLATLSGQPTTLMDMENPPHDKADALSACSPHQAIARPTDRAVCHASYSPDAAQPAQHRCASQGVHKSLVPLCPYSLMHEPPKDGIVSACKAPGALREAHTMPLHRNLRTRKLLHHLTCERRPRLPRHLVEASCTHTAPSVVHR